MQILPDGTRIDHTDTDKYYRDDEGRTRIQHNDGSGVIHDPPQNENGTGIHILPARIDAKEEDPGVAVVNGVTARGTGTTTTIEAGRSGNDQPVRIVTERWYSTELQLDIKTVISDPRYGETIDQMKDIQQGPRDEGLFRHPTPGRPVK